MSKITNDGLTRSGTGCFSCTVHPYGNSGRRRVKPRLHWRSTEQALRCLQLIAWSMYTLASIKPPSQHACLAARRLAFRTNYPLVHPLRPADRFLCPPTAVRW